MRTILPMLTALSLMATPALAQTVTGYSMTDASGTTATVFSIQPQTRVAAADYVKLTADALTYREQAARLAVRKAQRDDVRAYAQAQLAAAGSERGALMAALKNQDRTIARPTTRLSSARQAQLDLLRKAPRGSFDNLYLAQLTEAAPTMWALQKGYADDGADPALRQIATVSVPSTERGYTTAKGLMPASLSTTR